MGSRPVFCLSWLICCCQGLLGIEPYFEIPADIPYSPCSEYVHKERRDLTVTREQIYEELSPREEESSPSLDGVKLWSNTETREPYRIRIGDQFLISVYGEEGTEREVIVDPAGSISFLLLNHLKVIGKTVDKVRIELQQSIEGYFRYPLISITPIKFAEEYYTILGEVTTPGKKLVEGNSTILSALCEANGFTLRRFREEFIEQVDLDHSFLSRKGQFIPVNFQKLIVEGDITQDVPLQEGDFLYLETKLMNEVHILGYVRLPTTLEFFHTMTLVEAISGAGGLIYESFGSAIEADCKALVIRGSLASPVTYLVDISRIMRGVSPDFVLEPGDIVYVPPKQFSSLKEVIYGAIKAFVANAASIGGTSTFIRVVPDAAGDPLLGPVPTIPTSVFVP